MEAVLLKKTETYFVNNEEEAVALIEAAKHDNNYELIKYTNTKKEKKSKGEVVADWVEVTLCKKYVDIKDLIG